jgi:hypothetical protein
VLRTGQGACDPRRQSLLSVTPSRSDPAYVLPPCWSLVARAIMSEVCAEKRVNTSTIQRNRCEQNQRLARDRPPTTPLTVWLRSKSIVTKRRFTNRDSFCRVPILLAGLQQESAHDVFHNGASAVPSRLAHEGASQVLRTSNARKTGTRSRMRYHDRVATGAGVGARNPNVGGVAQSIEHATPVDAEPGPARAVNPREIRAADSAGP